MPVVASAIYIATVRPDIDVDWVASDIARTIDEHAIVRSWSVFPRYPDGYADITVDYVCPPHEVDAHAARGLTTALHHTPTDLASPIHAVPTLKTR